MACTRLAISSIASVLPRRRASALVARDGGPGFRPGGDGGFPAPARGGELRRIGESVAVFYRSADYSGRGLLVLTIDPEFSERRAGTKYLAMRGSGLDELRSFAQEIRDLFLESPAWGALKDRGPDPHYSVDHLGKIATGDHSSYPPEWNDAPRREGFTKKGSISRLFFRNPLGRVEDLYNFLQRAERKHLNDPLRPSHQLSERRLSNGSGTRSNSKVASATFRIAALSENSFDVSDRCRAIAGMPMVDQIDVSAAEGAVLTESALSSDGCAHLRRPYNGVLVGDIKMFRNLERRNLMKFVDYRELLPVKDRVRRPRITDAGRTALTELDNGPNA
jgi:hypothetical protein